MDNNFLLFKKAILNQGEDYKACQKFMNAINDAGKYVELQNAIFKFWPSIIMEHRDTALDFLTRNFDRFKQDLHTSNIFFNENTDYGRAIYYCKDGNKGCYLLSGKAEGWAFGKSYVKADCLAKLIGRDESVCYYEKRAKGQLFDKCVGRLYDGSSVSSNDQAEIFALSMNCSFVAGGNSTVYARSFNRGKAFGKSIVKGPSDKNLQLFDEAKYIKMEIR